MKNNSYVNQLVDGANMIPETLPAVTQRAADRPLPYKILDYVERQAGNLHHFALAPEFARTVSRAGKLHLPYPAISITFRRDDLLLNPLWFFGQGDIVDCRTDSIITFDVYDMLSTFNDAGRPPGMTAQLGDVFSIRTVAGDEVIALASLGRMIRPDGSGVITKAPSHADFIRMIGIECVNAVGCVVVALATRNILKTTSVNNRIGSGKRIKAKFEGVAGTVYLSTTLLDVPPANQLAPDPDHPAREGVSPRPHLRRGHIHTFAVGAGRAERKQKWLAPMFVNADPDFVARAREYVVK